MEAKPMVGSDFEFAFAVPVKPKTVLFRPLNGPTWISLTDTYVNKHTDFKINCHFSSRPRTSGLNWKLSVVYLWKVQHELWIEKRCPMPTQGNLLSLKWSGVFETLSVTPEILGCMSQKILMFLKCLKPTISVFNGKAWIDRESSNHLLRMILPDVHIYSC